MLISKRVPADRFVVLLRHGIAEDATGEMKDEDRALTSEGKARMKEIARGLARIVPEVDAIYSSPLVRAMQTAKRVAKVYGLDVTPTDALRLDAPAKGIAALLGAQRTILVGHAPELTRAIRMLAKAEVELKKGGCCGIRGTTLEWVLTPKVLRKLS